MSDNALNKSIRELVRTVLDLPANSVRRANQSKVQAGDAGVQYATVLVTGFESKGWDRSTLLAEASPSLNVSQVVDGQRRVSASIQFFRDGALVRARRLKSLLQGDVAVDLMQSLGLGLVHIAGVKDLTQIVNTLFEERAQLQVDFHVAASEAASIRTYGTFPISISTPDETANFEVTAP